MWHARLHCSLGRHPIALFGAHMKSDLAYFISQPHRQEHMTRWWWRRAALASDKRDNSQFTAQIWVSEVWFPTSIEGRRTTCVKKSFRMIPQLHSPLQSHVSSFMAISSLAYRTVCFLGLALDPKSDFVFMGSWDNRSKVHVAILLSECRLGRARIFVFRVS
jgi:hypothetical protein